jgi:hypothetical protein
MYPVKPSLALLEDRPAPAMHDPMIIKAVRILPSTTLAVRPSFLFPLLISFDFFYRSRLSLVHTPTM